MSIMDFFHHRKPKEQLAVLLDIGSASVGGALVLLAPEKAPRMLYTIRHEMRIERHIDFEKFINSMKKALDAVIADIQKDGIPHLTFTHRGSMAPSTVLCIFEAPWHASHVQVIRVTKQEPFRVDHAFLSGALNGEISSFKNAQSKRYLEEGVQKGEVKLIEKKLLRIELNGYEVENPYGKKAKNVTLHLFMGVVPTSVLALVQKKIKRAFHVEDEEIIFHSFTLASFATLRDVWEDMRDFLIVDVGGEVTEVSLVRSGALVEAVSFPVGKNFLVRKISRNLKVKHEEALSLLNIYAEEKGSREMSEHIAEVLADTRDMWLKAFRNALMNVGEGLLLPAHVFLIVDQTLLSWFEKLIEESNFEGENFIEKAFSVQRINRTTLSHFLEVNSSVRQDPFLSIDALFADKMIE